MRYAVVERATRTVANVIEAPEGWAVGRGYTLVASETAGPGDNYSATTLSFTPPARAAPSVSRREEYKAATTTARRLDVIAKHTGLQD